MSLFTDDGGGLVACDYFSGVFEYVEKILMGEDDDNLDDFSPFREHNACVLQATERYFYDVFKNPEETDDNNGISGSGVFNEGQRRKQIAMEAEMCDITDKYDKTLLCSKRNPRFYEKSMACPDQEQSSDDDISNKYIKPPELKRGRPKKENKKHTSVKEIIDFKTLLVQAAKALSMFETNSARKLLMEIKRCSSPYGDSTERLAYYFGNALDARLEGTGSMLQNSSLSRSIPSAEMLKCYQTYFRACPFQRMTNIVANKLIGMYTSEADKIHIIDFGIMDGFQWPCIIQGLSLKPGGPPKLKITGIDFPQAGLKPLARVEQTGKWLMNYCKRFNVPFEYHPVAKKWEEIQLEDLKIEENEMVVVNCMYKMRHVLEESGSFDLESPRDSILKLIRQISPCIFVHGVANASHGVPFFTTRFTEALHHYSCLFDMLEATVPREDKERQVYEREILGSEIMNVIACEASERVERPETYKKWQVRNQRAGFEQLSMKREILQEAKTKVKRCYHGDFLVEEDGKWMLQGWKGRVIYALSLWKPTS